jgi:hypothetical protein
MEAANEPTYSTRPKDVGSVIPPVEVLKAEPAYSTRPKDGTVIVAPVEVVKEEPFYKKLESVKGDVA